jgi:peptidyl-prolyl cis-trans isomerase SurA
MHRSTIASRPTRALICAATFLIAACQSKPAPPPAPQVSSDAWATVNGREITRQRVETEFQRNRDPSQPVSTEDALSAKLAILDELIVEDVLLARAATLKIDIPQAELDAAYAEAKKNIPDDAFQQELTRRNLTVADMRDGLRRDLLTRKVLERDVTSKITVTDQEVTDFFNANRGQFNLPEDAYHLAQIVITPAPDPQVTNRNHDDAKTPEAAAAKLSMLMERLKTGTPFADLARDYSEDPESAPRGGDLGMVPLSRIKQAPPALRDAALTVTPGNAKVASQGGAHTIVYVVSREPAGQRDLSTPGVKDRITTALRQRREQLLRSAYLTAARSDAVVVNFLARRVVDAQGKGIQ